MILKKKEFFLLIFLILLQSCSGGRIGNFLESSFNDLEKISQDVDLKNNLVNKKILIKEKKEIDDKKNKRITKVQKPKSDLENKKDNNFKKEKKEKKEIDDKKNKRITKAQKPKSDLENKKDKNFKKILKQKYKIKDSVDKSEIELQSYKIIFILKNVDPKDPTENLSTILRNSDVNFEIERIERILDSKNKNMNIN